MDKQKALKLDQEDPLKHFKDRFLLPQNFLYFCHHSLGLPAKSASTMMHTHMQTWADLGVEGWFQGENNWYTSIDLALRKPLAQMLGAREDEVVVMNSLTVNLHLLMVSFYKPTKIRYKILIESPTFPSDLYAIKDHLQRHGLDPNKALIALEPKKKEDYLLTEDAIQDVIEKEGETIAIIFFNTINFLTGQSFDMKKISALAKEKGCIIGCNIAHAAGNIPLYLHDWNIDFAVGCSYKYLCSGPGGPGIAYVHRSHHHRELPRFSGWWGNDPNTRFKMHLEPHFIPYGGARSWQLSTPSILSMIPLVESLKLFAEAGIERMRTKSELQTTFLIELLDEISNSTFEILTPRDPQSRGSQLSLLFHQEHYPDTQVLLKNLEKHGLICDFRPPNIIRVTPSALYTSFHDIYELTQRFTKILQS